MRKRRALWLLTGLLVLAALAMLIPGSPAYAPRLFARYGHYYDGHSAGYWTDSLNSPDDNLRKRAMYALGALGADAGEAVPALATIMLEDPDGDMRREASLALSKMVPASAAAVPALARALSDEEPMVRINAAFTLLRLRGEARPAIPALIRAIKEQRNQELVGQFLNSVQAVATQALGRAGAGSPEAATALAEALESARTDKMRITAARALGDVGAEARRAEPQLRALLKDENKEVREAAEAALRRIEGGPSAE